MEEPFDTLGAAEDSPQSHESKKAEYQGAGNDPQVWWFKGRRLLLASAILWKHGSRIPCPVDDPLSIPVGGERSFEADPGFVRAMNVSIAAFAPALMLRAFGVEVLLKALYLDGGGRLAEDGQFVSPTKNPHALRALAARANFTVFGSEERLLDCLEYWMQEGRYPIQSSVSKYARGGENAAPLTHGWTPDQEETWRAFVIRLLRQGNHLLYRPPVPSS